MAFGQHEDSDTKERIQWLKDNRGVSAETLDDKKKNRGFLSKLSTEDTRYNLAKEDSWFSTVDNKTMKKALSTDGKKKRGWFGR